MTTSGNKFTIIYAKSVKKDIKNIPPDILSLIKTSIEELQNFPHLSNIKKLSSHPLADFRLRVGNYRILFDVDFDNNIIEILKIGHRRDVYDE